MAQNSYQKGWDYLNNANFDNAEAHFIKASKDKLTKDQANLVLTMLYSSTERVEKAAHFFDDFYSNAADPSAELYALWEDEGVIGTIKKFKPYQVELLKKIATDSRFKSKLAGNTNYHLLMNEIYSYKKELIESYDAKFPTINNWSVLGPFDNVMNSGFNKNFGVIENPNSTSVFKSKYGATIKWLEQENCTSHGYYVAKRNFIDDNSIIYAQSFVESPIEQDVILKFGFSGSLKVWLNDTLTFSEIEKRSVQMDYYQIKCHLNKGFNRVLVQLGDYNETFPNFILRFTNTENESLSLNSSAKFQEYQKNKYPIQQLNFFAIEKLKANIKQKPDDILNKILLFNCHLHSFELEEAEEIMNELLEKYPKNYLVLRNAIFLMDKSKNATMQNKYYEYYKELYPNDANILSTEIKDAYDKKEKERMQSLMNNFNKQFYSEYKNYLFEIMEFGLSENLEKAYEKINEFYNKYPNDYWALNSKYQMAKELKETPTQLNSYLEKYISTNLDPTVLDLLATGYVNEGKINEAIKLYENAMFALNGESTFDKKIINLYSTQRNYEQAIVKCKSIIEKCPSDYQTWSDLGILSIFKNDTKNAIVNYEEALRFFPFSFENNEKIRELKKLKFPYELKEKFNYAEVISDFEKNQVPNSKKSYEILLDKKTFIVYKTRASAARWTFVVRINQESAIEDWQKLTISPFTNMALQLLMAKTIKKNGNKIDAEKNGDEVVFTNLEIGDYIVVDYTMKQNNGSKSAMFINDVYGLNSLMPVYNSLYEVFVEEGLKLNYQITNTELNPIISNTNGFQKFVWKITNPVLITPETNRPNSADIGINVHVSIDDSWTDVAQWYSDLSTQQAEPDFTIYQLAKQLFPNKAYSEEEKAKIIYEFVCKNIQYSSIEFRQGSFIPQKASKVYHTRLGDCKDVSTLFASIARVVGLDVNLILISTSDNGKKSVMLPSLNFNHCIVKVNFKNGKSKYLELTNPNLPYGYLSYYHHDATILEIPYKKQALNSKLDYLSLNEGYVSKAINKVGVQVNANNSVDIQVNVLKTGTEAAQACTNYHDNDDETNIDNIKKSLATDFKSAIKVHSLVFEQLSPRLDTAKYAYKFSAENELSKVGSFKTLKIPFGFIIAKPNIFDEGERKYDFDYNSYEQVDFYEEKFEINIEKPLKILEVPENVLLQFKGNKYELQFDKVNDQKMLINRTYQMERKNISVKDFYEFKTFITKIIEAENTSLIFK